MLPFTVKNMNWGNIVTDGLFLQKVNFQMHTVMHQKPGCTSIPATIISQVIPGVQTQKFIKILMIHGMAGW